LLRQLLVEGAVLSAAGAAAGLALAAVGSRLLSVLLAAQLPRTLGPPFEASVLVFTAAIGVLTTAVFGIVPALPVLRGRVATPLKDDEGRGSASRRTGRLRTALAGAELATAVVLLAGAGLLVESFARVTAVDPGFTPDRVLTAQMTLPSSRYPDPASRRAFWSALVERARALPGVTYAGVVSSLPFGGRPSAGAYAIVGRPIPPGGTPLHAQDDWVAGDYFRAMGIPLVEGRFFTDADSADAPRVVIVDRLFAERQLAGGSPIG